MAVPLPTDGQAMRNYTENYTYDAVGNFLELAHTANLGNWTRTYAYGEPTVPPASNRLSSTTVTGVTERYTYDAHGNMVSMPHLSLMQWDWKDQLQATASQIVKAAHQRRPTTGTTAAGERIVKATNNQNGRRMAERIYLGGYEVYRTYDSNGNVTLERQSLHVGSAAVRICLIETTTIDATAPPGSLPDTLSRYQLANHLGSAVLELDDAAAVITYEEYYPYGSTAFLSARSAAEVGLKRYRYSGKERDEESGFCYYGARYYVPWLGRWLSCDPARHRDGPSLYAFVHDNPASAIDPNGEWTWKQAAVVGAVVAVAIVVSIATAGLGAAAVAAAASTVGGTALGATGAAAVTVAGTVGVGAIAGGLSAAGADITGQALTKNAGQAIDWHRTEAAGAGGAVAGGVLGVIPGIAAARSVSQAVRAGATSAEAIAAVRSSTTAAGSITRQLVTGAGKGVAAGTVGGGIDETTRQIVSGDARSHGGLDVSRITSAAIGSAAFGAAGAALGTGARAAFRNIRTRAAAFSAARAPGARGPAAAAVHEPASGRVFIGTNAPPNQPLHPALRQRAAEFADIPSTGEHPNYYGRTGQAHAELNALSEALYGREAALGRPVGADEFGDLLLHVVQRRGGGAGLAMPRCSRCNFLTSGVDLTMQSASGEQSQFETILAGQWQDDRPF